MEDQVLKELKDIKKVLAHIAGTEELPSKQKFSTEALDKVAKEFRQLSAQRDEWVKDWDLYKIFKGSHYGISKLIIETFGFTNYFKHGHSLYFNKKDLLTLKAELKKRNVDIGRYQDLLDDQKKFNQKYKDLKTQIGKKGKHYKIPEELKDIVTSQTKPDSDQIIRDHIASLKKEFKENNLSQYIDVYLDTHAMIKGDYMFERYRNKELARQLRKWCNDFNYANRALMEYNKLGIQD